MALSILYGAGLGVVLVTAVVVVASMLSSQISRGEEGQPPATPEPPAQGRRVKVLWVDGQPTLSYSIVRLPRHWLN
ncbi:MAG TPA: hypothetical protein PL105_01065 [Caldilineaceae bacterium]|nr:hypothetical protein [Caldilineaceae bacterium]